MRDDQRDSTRYFESCTGKIVTPNAREVESKAGSGDDPMDVDSLIKVQYEDTSTVKGKRIWQAIDEQRT